MLDKKKIVWKCIFSIKIFQREMQICVESFWEGEEDLILSFLIFGLAKLSYSE